MAPESTTPETKKATLQDDEHRGQARNCQERNTSPVSLAPNRDAGKPATDPESNENNRSEEDIELETPESRTSPSAIPPPSQPEAQPEAQPEEQPASLRRIPTTASQSEKRFQATRKFWRRNVSVAVPHKYCRDHLALERTFLGYVRTSVALTMIAAVIVQLYPMQVQGKKVEHAVTFPKLGKPLASLFVVAAILNVLFGACRFWRQQSAMVRGLVYTRTWELWGSGVLVLLVS